MYPITRIFWLNSLVVLAVTVERFSRTTRVVLPPHDFLSLHQLIQTAVLILASLVLAMLLFWETSGHLKALPGRSAVWLIVLFTAGAYLYGAGEGLHELASYLLGTRCDVDHPVGDLCGGLFVNDFYTGNILFFAGAALVTAVPVVAERLNANPDPRRPGPLPLIVNATVFAFTVVAYAAFDTVLVGLVFALGMLVFTAAMWLPVRARAARYPVTTYSFITYALGAVISLVIRLV
ncbi:hypothetical protein [Actinoplanes sp. NPDC051411]|uniref:hypothetical protein n=1 Tax=Actinoplanes sp. NPDC051411 TaxID=3155522 RepID=UPI003440F782